MKPNTLAPAPTRPLRIVSRGSMLALWQARYVARLLEDRGAQTHIQVVKTTGDRVQDRFLHEIGGKGLFIKELEQALLAGEADLAVHSLKDMPALVPSPFSLVAILKRHSPCDLLILGPKMADTVKTRQTHSHESASFSAQDTAALGPCIIATGSLRRTALLAFHAPQAKTSPIRGNVDTRLQKLMTGEWDAMILAEASLDRLGLKTQHPSMRLNPNWFIPSASQGALAIECRDDSPVRDFVRGVLNDSITEHAVTLERRVLALLGGDCTMPFGCHVTEDVGGWIMRAGIYTPTGHAATATTPVDPAPLCFNPASESPILDSWVTSEAQRMLDALRKAGGAQILSELGLKEPPFWSEP